MAPLQERGKKSFNLKVSIDVHHIYLASLYIQSSSKSMNYNLFDSFFPIDMSK